MKWFLAASWARGYDLRLGVWETGQQTGNAAQRDRKVPITWHKSEERTWPNRQSGQGGNVGGALSGKNNQVSGSSSALESHVLLGSRRSICGALSPCVSCVPRNERKGSHLAAWGTVSWDRCSGGNGIWGASAVQRRVEWEGQWW